MTAQEITARTRVSITIPVLAGLVVGGASGVGAAYAMRDQMVREFQTVVRQQAVELEDRRAEALRYYATRDELLRATQRVEGRLIRVETLLEQLKEKRR